MSLWLILGTALLLFGCNSIFEPEGDCPNQFEPEEESPIPMIIKFTHTMNINETDAFGPKVNTISVFVFEKDGPFVTLETETEAELLVNDYTMAIDVPPGVYDIVTWAGLTENESFVVAGGDNPVSKEELICSLNKLTFHDEDDEDNNPHSYEQLDPLFHGLAEGVIFDGYNTEPVTVIDLIKNTNTIRIIMHYPGNREIIPDEYHIRITDNNGNMNYDNTLIDDDDDIIYHAWEKRTSYLADYSSRAEENENTSKDNEERKDNVLIAELDVVRLVTTQNPVLNVTRDNQEKPILSLPLIDLLLIAKSEVRPMPDQEYLDRQDEYNIYFILDANGEYKPDDPGKDPDYEEVWNTSLGIFVNGWHMVFQDSGL